VNRRNWLWLAGAVGLALGGRTAEAETGGAGTAGAGPGGSGTSRSPLVAAHRGGSALWPENSLLAFRNALALGVDLVETDVHLTSDGEVVVIHDPTLDRTTTGTGPIGSVRLGDLASVRLKARDGSVTEETLPSLTALLDLLAPSRAGLLLEIKTDAARQPYPDIEQKALRLIDARGLSARTVVMAFEPDAVRRVRALAPSMRTALLVGRGQVDGGRAHPEDAVRWTSDLGATHLGIDYRALDAKVVAAARQANISVAAWTVNDEAEIRRVVSVGVDAVISDRPDLALRVVGRPAGKTGS
jgi:glycerophosphoryl diester phosphodiesterase